MKVLAHEALEATEACGFLRSRRSAVSEKFPESGVTGNYVSHLNGCPVRLAASARLFAVQVDASGVSSATRTKLVGMSLGVHRPPSGASSVRYHHAQSADDNQLRLAFRKLYPPLQRMPGVILGANRGL